MRGLEMEVYRNAQDTVGNVDNLGGLNGSITIDSVNGSFRTIETAMWETPFNYTRQDAGE